MKRLIGFIRRQVRINQELQQVARMSDRELRDIGITRYELNHHIRSQR